MFRKQALESVRTREEAGPVQPVGRRMWFVLAAVGVALAALIAWSLTARIPSYVQARGVVLPGEAFLTITAPGDGIVRSLRTPGAVEAGGEIARLEVPGNEEVVVRSDRSVEILGLRATVGAHVRRGAPLAVGAASGAQARIALYLPAYSAESVRGEARVEIVAGRRRAPAQLSGGRSFVVDTLDLSRRLQSDGLAAWLTAETPVVELFAEFDAISDASRFWVGEPVTVRVMTHVRTPAELLLGTRGSAR